MADYVSPERVVRDGRLVAYEGEVMSEAEARRRGLLVDKPAKKTTRRRRKAE